MTQTHTDTYSPFLSLGREYTEFSTISNASFTSPFKTNMFRFGMTRAPQVNSTSVHIYQQSDCYRIFIVSLHAECVCEIIEESEEEQLVIACLLVEEFRKR